MTKEIISVNSIHKFIVDELLTDASVEIEPQEDLLLSGFLDSLSVIRLVTYLEAECSASIPPEDITIENFGTIEKIHHYVNAELPTRTQ